MSPCQWMLVGTFELIYDFHMKSVGLFRRVSMRPVGLFDCDDSHLFAQDLERNFLDEETHRF